MIDWYLVTSSALCILGCAVILTIFSYADWLAGRRGVRLRDVLDGANWRISLGGGVVLVCLGLFFASRHWWEYAAWGLLTTFLVGWGYQIWRKRRESGKISSRLLALSRMAWRPLVGTVFGVVVLYLAFRNVKLDQIRDSLLAANYGLVALAIACVFLALALNTVRWRLLFYPRQRQVRWHNLFAGIIVGQMVNIVIPARLGEVVRSYAVGQNESISKMLVLGTIVVEKVMDFLMMGLGFAALFPLMAMPQWVAQPGKAVAILGGTMLVGVLTLAFWGEHIVGLMQKVGRWLPGQTGAKLTQYGERALEGFGSLRDWRVSFLVWGCSCLIWFVGVVTHYIVFRAMGLSLPITAALFLMVVLKVGNAPPSSPGKIGVYHYLTLIALSAFSVERDLALSYAVLMHLIIYLPKIVLGGIYIVWPGRGLFRASARAMWGTDGRM